ncbi:hypothetical protein MRX96_031897 [Rhipicephalus microplus]
MPNWYYSKKALRKTPSYLDGISVEKEQRYRREGARFIINVGTKMGLRYDTMATGVVYFHRFYMFHSFKTFPRFITACCCLFLAGKVEETPKKCKDIIKTARSFLTDKQYLSFGEDPKEEVMTMERILLQTIKFDLQVSHPYGFLLKYAKCLKGDKSKLQKMVQMAWTFINDSLCTTLCLQWEPEVVAIALIYLAGQAVQVRGQRLGRAHLAAPALVGGLRRGHHRRAARGHLPPGARPVLDAHPQHAAGLSAGLARAARQVWQALAAPFPTKVSCGGATHPAAGTTASAGTARPSGGGARCSGGAVNVIRTAAAHCTPPWQVCPSPPSTAAPASP